MILLLTLAPIQKVQNIIGKIVSILREPSTSTMKYAMSTSIKVAVQQSATDYTKKYANINNKIVKFIYYN